MYLGGNSGHGRHPAPAKGPDAPPAHGLEQALIEAAGLFLSLGLSREKKDKHKNRQKKDRNP
jgi:hypothetical protein